MTDEMTETIYRLYSGLYYRECQFDYLLSTLYSVAGKQYPGQVLSFLGRPTASITIGDVLTEISCTPICATLLRSLKYGIFSSRLLVQIDDFNFTSKIGQIYIDGNVYLGVRLIEKFVPGRTSTFLIDNKFYRFQNYEVVHADTNIYDLSSTLASINARYDAINFQASTHVFPSSTFSFKNVNSFSQIISETNMVQDQLSSLFQHSDSSSTAYVPSHVLDTTSSALKHIFL